MGDSHRFGHRIVYVALNDINARKINGVLLRPGVLRMPVLQTSGVSLTGLPVQMHNEA
jgi:hypothetical protein